MCVCVLFVEKYDLIVTLLLSPALLTKKNKNREPPQPVINLSIDAKKT